MDAKGIDHFYMLSTINSNDAKYENIRYNWYKNIKIHITGELESANINLVEGCQKMCENIYVYKCILDKDININKKDNIRVELDGDDDNNFSDVTIYDNMGDILFKSFRMTKKKIEILYINPIGIVYEKYKKKYVLHDMLILNPMGLQSASAYNNMDGSVIYINNVIIPENSKTYILNKNNKKLLDLYIIWILCMKRHNMRYYNFIKSIIISFLLDI